jgi:multidrug efflux pump subunit AcrA (membrane-fusion protein)
MGTTDSKKPLRWSAEENLQRFNLTRPLARLCGTVGIIAGLALIITPWQQTSRGHGRVIAFSPNDRVQNIDAPVDGRVLQWYVQEGSKVKEGDPIVEISDLDPQFLSNIRKERDAIKKRLQASSSAAETSNLNLVRQKQLFEEGLSSRKDFERAQVEYSNLLAAEANASAELTRIDVRLSRQENQMIRAPREGIIQTVLSGQGEAATVKSGQRLAVLVPNTHLRSVELYIDGNDLPLIQEGRLVRLQFEGWPAVQFSGWPNVAVGTFGGRVANIDPSDNGSGEFRLLVIPENMEEWPDQRYLRQGTRAIGWILLDQVSAGYEIWRKLNGFPPMLKKKPTETQGTQGTQKESSK